MSFIKQKSDVYYEQMKVELKDQKGECIREITPEFYAKEDDSKAVDQSMIEENPSCRYCYSKTVTQ